MGKATQENIDFVLKSKRDEIGEIEENPLPVGNDPFSIACLFGTSNPKIREMTNEVVWFRDFFPYSWPARPLFSFKLRHCRKSSQYFAGPGGVWQHWRIFSPRIGDGSGLVPE